MDAGALLKAQGWRGHGHSLHSTDDSIGLAKPLLISRKDNTLGIGKKDHVTSDQWWLNAFDQQLKGLDTTKKGTVVQKETKGGLNLLATGTGKYKGAMGLYACFVRAGQLEGTITPAESETTTGTDSTGQSGDAEAPAKKETKEERRARKKARRLRKAEKAARRGAEEQDKVTKPAKEKRNETKEDRRARKEAKRKRRAEKQRSKAG